MEGYKGRTIGRGMKPRGTHDNRAEDTRIVPMDTEDDEGHQSENLKILRDPDQRLPDPHNLETPISEDSPIGSESGPDDGFVAVTEANPLADLMRKSAEHNEQEVSAGMANLLNLNENPNPTGGEILKSDGAIITTTMTMEEIQERFPLRSLHIPVPDFVTPLGTDNTITVGPPMGLGEQPDGTFKIVVTIPEGYIEPMRQQAESDHETLEEWASKNYSEYLASWWSPPRMA